MKIKSRIAPCVFILLFPFLAMAQTPVTPSEFKPGIDKIQTQLFVLIKKEFDIDLQTRDQLINFINQQIADFYGKLRSCTPSTSKYMLPSAIPPFLPNVIITTSIVGLDSNSNRCIVNSKYQFIGGSNATVMTMHCQYTQGSIAYFSDDAARAIARGEQAYYTQIKAIMENECQIENSTTIPNTPPQAVPVPSALPMPPAPPTSAAPQ